MTTQDKLADSGTGHDKQRTAADWITLAISVSIIIATVGLTTYVHLFGPHNPPHIQVDIQNDKMFQQDDRYYTPVTIMNAGNITAQDLDVTLILTIGDKERETHIAVPFLAGGGSRNAVIVFPVDPRSGTISVDSVTFQKP